MTRPIFVVDAFASGPFRGNPAAVVLLEPGDAPDDRVDAAGRRRDEALGDRLRAAARRRRLRPALVHARGRGRPLRARDARERARALGDGPARARRSRRCSTPAAASCGPAARATATVELDFPTAPPEPCDPPAGLLEALGIDKAESLLRRPASSSCSWSPTRRPCASSSPTSWRCGALADVRGVYVTAAGDDGVHDIVSRCFAPRVGIDEDPVTGSMHCVLERLLVRPARHDRAARAAGLGARRHDARAARRRPHAAHRQRRTVVRRMLVAPAEPRLGSDLRSPWPRSSFTPVCPRRDPPACSGG